MGVAREAGGLAEVMGKVEAGWGAEVRGLGEMGWEGAGWVAGMGVGRAVGRDLRGTNE